MRKLLFTAFLFAGCSQQTPREALQAFDGPAESSPKQSGAPARVAFAPPSEGPGFAFPEDRGGALLAKTLAPAEPKAVAERTQQPRSHPGALRIESPSLPLTAGDNGIPRIALASKHAALPHPVVEQNFYVLHAEALLPATVLLAVGERVQIPSIDVNRPLPAPILAKPLPDRVPLDDATAEASTAAALSAVIAPRTQPAPFLKLTLPEPFENRRPVTAPVTVTETVPNTTPRLPKP